MLGMVCTYSLGHTDTGIADGEGLVDLIGDDVDAEVLASIELAGVGQGLVPDLVERIGSVGDELTEENLLVGVDGVDDEREQLRDLSLELEGLRHDGGIGYQRKRESELRVSHCPGQAKAGASGQDGSSRQVRRTLNGQWKGPRGTSFRSNLLLDGEIVGGGEYEEEFV